MPDGEAVDDRLEERMHDKADRELGRIGVAEPKGREWIKTTDRRPDKSGRYLATVKYHSGWSEEYVVFYNKDSKEEWAHDDFPVIAWMPLPEPYEGGAE